MSYCNWEDFDEQTPAHQPFNVLASGGKLLISGMVYQMSIQPWPSMCGGRCVTIRPRALWGYDSSSLGPQVTGLDDLHTRPLACHDSGLVFVDALVPCRTRVDFIHYLRAYVAKLNELDGYRASVALPSTTALDYRKPDLSDHVYVYALISVANEARHDGHGHDAYDEWVCEECGGDVDSDGWCEDCDWHTECPEQHLPEEDYWMTGEPDVDYEEGHGHEATVEAYAYRRNSGTVLSWAHNSCWETTAATGSSRASAFVHVAIESSGDPLHEELDVMALVRRCLAPALYYKGPVLISSNIAEPMYATPSLMAALIRHQPELRACGIELVRVREHFATNPNERHHYIDGMVLVPCYDMRIKELMTAGGHVI